jgi:hypothetical protein
VQSLANLRQGAGTPRRGVHGMRLTSENNETDIRECARCERRGSIADGDPDSRIPALLTGRSTGVRGSPGSDSR